MTVARAAFCACIDTLLQHELSAGNRLGQSPHRANWPREGSVFATLDLDFRTRPAVWPPMLQYGICNDIRYGWYEDCTCTLHHHLLVAGPCRPPTAASPSQKV